MNQKRLIRISLVTLGFLGAFLLLGAQPALACYVCNGDPNSAMSQGAQAGVLVLLGVIGTVLTALASLIIFWMRRAANLARPANVERLSAHEGEG